jgi:WD40 repeat protein
LESEFGKLSQFTISSQATHLGAVGSGSIVLYDLTTGEQLTNYLIAENTSYGLLFDTDGKAYLGYTQYIYNQEYEGYEEFTSLESLGEQNLLVSRFSPVSKWYYPTLAHMYSATNPLARMDPDSLRIVTRRSNMDNVELLVYDPMSIYPIFESVCFNRPMDNGDLPQQILFHPLQENLMAVAQCGEGARKSSCELIVWDLSNGPSSAHPPLAVDGPIQALAFHPQGDLMAIVTGDGNLEIWDWQQGVQISGIDGFINGITWLGFSSDGNYLVAKPKLTRDPITIWSFETGKIHSQIPSDVNGERKVLNIALHSQLPWLGIAYGDRAVVWDIEKQSQIAELRGVETHQIYDWITFHPAGKQLATGGKDGIVQWDLETFESLSPVVQGFSYGELTFLGYDPSGRWLVNGGHGVYTLIDPETGKLIGKLSPTFVDSFEDQGIFDLLPIPSFSCDGSRMVAYARGNDLLFWQLDLESWEIAACRMANRSMTPDEWKTYLGDLPYNATCP